ncbi:hypothetical protein V1512DRAFT_210275 [Lipomyces arxii]|uniref:uncharacterized protein n=1 Tax=Lipomyces arxii TaxID=56418 RepID=UPI0034CD69BF
MRSFSESLAGRLTPQTEGVPFKIEHMRRWITCYCVLDFNVDIGPEFEAIYPPVQFSEQDLKTICFSSFPEQGYPDSAEAFHTFRFKSTSNLPFPPSAISPQLSQSPFQNEKFLYAYVLFQQRKDASRARHYSQKSLALISPFEFPALFEVVVRKAATYCFGPALIPTLQTAAGHIACWPAPEHVMSKFLAGNGKRKFLDLPYLGDKIRVVVSSESMVPLADLADKEADVYMFGKTGSWGTIVKTLDGVADLFAIYESTVLGQSIAVLADTPSLCSQLVSNAIDLTKPIPYTGLVREYVTMHTDIENLNIISRDPVPGIIGFTNPFLAQMVTDCKGTVRLIDVSKRPQSSASPSLNVSFFPILPDLMPLASEPEPMTIDLLYPVTATVDWQVKSFKKMLDTVGITQAASSASKSTTYLTRDPAFVKAVNRMLENNASPGKIDKYIRVYFANLTARILAPIKRYLFVAQLSSKQFGFVEFMYYMTQATGTQSHHEVVVNDDQPTESRLEHNRTSPSIFGNMNILSSLNISNLSNSEPPVSPTSTPLSELLGGLSLTSSVSPVSSATTTQDISTDLYIQAVMPDKGVFTDYAAAVAFYGVLLRSSNFEAWCFM